MLWRERCANSDLSPPMCNPNQFQENSSENRSTDEEQEVESDRSSPVKHGIVRNAAFRVNISECSNYNGQLGPMKFGQICRTSGFSQSGCFKDLITPALRFGVIHVASDPIRHNSGTFPVHR